MSTASFQAPTKTGPLRNEVSSFWAPIATHVALTTLTVFVAYWVGPVLGLPLPLGAMVILGAGSLAIQAAPVWALEITAAVGVLLLARLNSVYTAYHLVLVGTL